MFEGYMSLGGNEIINVARTKAYVEAGYVPPGVNVDVCVPCDGLDELLGDEPYRSPLQDEPPWFESGNPDTWDFAGIIPLEMTGASGSTRTATVTELNGDGSAVSGTRYAGRTIAVTALLVGRTGCSVEAGLSWLSQVLGGSNCTGWRPNTPDACSGDELCMFTCCPGEVNDTPLGTGELVTEDVPTTQWRATGGWFDAFTGTFDPSSQEPAGTWTNLVTNPSFEDGTLAGWTFNVSNNLYDVTTAQWPARFSTHSARITQTSATIIATLGTRVAMPAARPWVNIGMYVGTTTAQTRVRMRVTFYDAAGATVAGGTTVSRELNVQSYTRLAVSLARPATATEVSVQVIPTDVGSDTVPSDLGTVVYVDGVVVTNDNASLPARYFDGDMTDIPGATYAWTGTPRASTSTKQVVLPVMAITGTPVECYEDALFNFGVTAPEKRMYVTPKALDLDGNVLWTGTRTSVLSKNPLITIVPDERWGSWVPQLVIDPFYPYKIIVEPTLTHARYNEASSCADDLLRSYLDVKTINGPRVVQKLTTDCGEFFYKVEWTMVAGNPMILGPTTVLASEVLASTATAKHLALGVQTGRLADTLLEAATECSTTTSTFNPLNVFDLCCPGFRTPPRLPSLTDTCFDKPTSYERTWIQIPSDYAPEIEDGLLSITLLNDGHNKRGVRVRVYPDPLGTGYAGHEECDFCDEFFVTYIPANATWRLDGVQRRVTTQLAGADRQVVTSASVRGRDGGPFAYPVMSCNTGYLIVVDVPDQYLENCGTDCAGYQQGTLWVDVTMRRSTL